MAIRAAEPAAAREQSAAGSTPPEIVGHGRGTVCWLADDGSMVTVALDDPPAR